MKDYQVHNKTVGTLADNGQYERRAKFSKHYCMKHSGWGIQSDIIDDLIKNNARKVVIFEEEKEEYWVADIDDFDKFGIEDDLGAGKQVFLHADYWRLYDVYKNPLNEKKG